MNNEIIEANKDISQSLFYWTPFCNTVYLQELTKTFGHHNPCFTGHPFATIENFSDFAEELEDHNPCFTGHPFATIGL